MIVLIGVGFFTRGIATHLPFEGCMGTVFLLGEVGLFVSGVRGQ